MEEEGAGVGEAGEGAGLGAAGGGDGEGVAGAVGGGEPGGADGGEAFGFVGGEPAVEAGEDGLGGDSGGWGWGEGGEGGGGAAEVGGVGEVGAEADDQMRTFGGGSRFDENAGELAVVCEEVVGPFQVELSGGGEGVEGVAEGDGGEEGVMAGGAEVGDGDGGGEVEVAGGDCQRRAPRPRPAVWTWARRAVPAISVMAARRRSSEEVESMVSSCSRRKRISLSRNATAMAV